MWTFKLYLSFQTCGRNATSGKQKRYQNNRDRIDVALFYMSPSQNKEAYHASSGASTSGFVKRLRHCSRVKCPALAVSLREPGSSSYSSSLELTRTYSFRRSLFFHTSSRVASSGSSASASSAEGKKNAELKMTFLQNVKKKKKKIQPIWK